MIGETGEEDLVTPSSHKVAQVDVNYSSQTENIIPPNDNITMAPSVKAGLDRDKKSRNGNNTGSGGSGNNSDNSGLVSMGNNSFGFNFDSEDVIGGTGNNSPSSDQNDSDQSEMKESNKRTSETNPLHNRKEDTEAVGTTTSQCEDNMKLNIPEHVPSSSYDQSSPSESNPSNINKNTPHVSRFEACNAGETSTNMNDSNGSSAQISCEPPTNKSLNEDNSSKTPSHDLAAAAVESLRSVVKSSKARWEQDNALKKNNIVLKESTIKRDNISKQNTPAVPKRDADEDESDEDGYHSDDEGDENMTVNSSSRTVSSQLASSSSKEQSSRKRNKTIDNFKREERNAREKERSFRISRQINELRSLLSSGGVIVPKGTKSSVLTEAANYIRMLQQHQYRSEIDRHQLIQQMQMIGAGALGPQAAGAIRHVAVQNGVWSLGNFGGVPPRSAMSFYNQESNEGGTERSSSTNTETDVRQVKDIEEHEYRHIFNSCAVAMAIASMGGAFIDCNELFCQLSQYTKQEVCAMTIFNMTSRSDLQHAFDLISQMISPPSNSQHKPPPCILQGSMKNRNDLGLSISLVKSDDDGIAKCFCVTLVKNPIPFSSRPTNVMSETTLPQQGNNDNLQKSQRGNDMSSPAYTTG